MTFQLDTSGFVQMPLGTLVFWDKNPTAAGLSPLAQGYVEAMFAEGIEAGATQIEARGNLKDWGFSDLAPETLARIMEDCATWAKQDVSGAGRRFWADRQKGWKGDKYPPLSPYLGDDGKVYLREGT